MKISPVAICFTLASVALAHPIEATSENPDDPHQLFSRSILCLNNYRCSSFYAHEIVQHAIDSGTTEYPVDDNWRVLFAYGPCRIEGRAKGKKASSYGRDIGYGCRNIINKCQKEPNGPVGGANTAGGNGNFLVRLEGS